MLSWPCYGNNFFQLWVWTNTIKIGKICNQHFFDPAIFWSSRAQKSPFWPPSVKLAPKFFPPINFWFFDENQLITLLFHPSFQEILPFGHLGVKRATWFWAFFNLSKILCFNIWFLFYSTGVIVLGLNLFHWPKFSGSGYFLILHRPEYCQKTLIFPLKHNSMMFQLTQKNEILW